MYTQWIEWLATKNIARVERTQTRSYYLHTNAYMESRTEIECVCVCLCVFERETRDLKNWQNIIYNLSKRPKAAHKNNNNEQTKKQNE